MDRFSGTSVRLASPRGVTVALAIASVIALSAVAGTAQASTHKKAEHTKAAETKADPDGCKPTPEQASIGIRALQTELMVAGLKCSAEEWNNFTATFKNTIKKDADRLQSVFRKAYGKGGSSEMNSFVTQLANDASQRSNGSSEEDYCKQEEVLFRKVFALTGEQLERFSAARRLDVPTPVSLCKPEPETPEATQTVAGQPGSSLVAATAAAAIPAATSPANPVH